MKSIAWIMATALLAGCSLFGPDEPAGDPLRGKQVHAVCMDCHGEGLYASADRKIKSLTALRKEVARWGDYYDPALSLQDNEDVVAYLNTNFYKFGR